MYFSLNWAKCSSRHISKQCLWDKGDVRVLAAADAVCRSRACAHNFQLCYALSKLPDFTEVFWQAFSTLCCNTSKSLMASEYTTNGVPTSQTSGGLRSGDRVGQLSGPPRPIQRPPKVLFRCCPTMQCYLSIQSNTDVVYWCLDVYWVELFCPHSVTACIRSRVQKFPAWHTKAAPNGKCREGYTGCFTTLGHNCRRWFPRFLWSKKFI